MPVENLFLSVGAMKAGTTFLFNALSRHPELYFTPEKELHYFAHTQKLSRPLQLPLRPQLGLGGRGLRPGDVLTHDFRRHRLAAVMHNRFSKIKDADVLRDMLGHQRDLASALITMICFANGEPIGEEPENLTIEHPAYTNIQLNKLIGAGKLPESKTVLVDRVRRQLEGLSPLSKGDREEEREVFHGLLNKLIPDINIIGGADMAEAVTTRQSTIINKGGQKGMKEAAASVLPTLADPGRKAGYLLSLLESKLGSEVLGAEIDNHLDALLVGSPSVNHLVREKLPPNKKMAKITSIFNRITKSALPDNRKEQLTSRIDELLASYIVKGKILDKIDNSERPLHVRAFMLVSMVQPEMLPKGKASNLAREIIVNHLKRPNFESELVSQIPDPKEQANTLRKFHEQLHRCGFFG